MMIESNFSKNLRKLVYKEKILICLVNLNLLIYIKIKIYKSSWLNVDLLMN